MFSGKSAAIFHPLRGFECEFRGAPVLPTCSRQGSVDVVECWSARVLARSSTRCSCVNMDFVNSVGVPGVVFGALIGFSVLVLMYIVKLVNGGANVTIQGVQQKCDSTTSQQDRGSKKTIQSASHSKSKKKQSLLDARWGSRIDRQTFAHPWLLKNLKGHTDQVLDVDFAPNGKYLASCSEDPDPATSSDSNKENSPSATPKPKQGLSRRQRKNRRRDTSPKLKKDLLAVAPLKQCEKLNMNEREFHDRLSKYLLTYEQLIAMGYPFSDECGRVRFFQCSNFNSSRTVFDVNAREFVPNFDNASSSGSSSDSGESEDCDSYQKNVAVDEPSIERMCVRCGKGFFTTTKEYLTRECCSYHWGKPQTVCGVNGVPIAQFSCCQKNLDSIGCTFCKLHVWNGVVSGFNGPLDGFVQTRSKKNAPADGNYGVYALDSEMCYTVAGLELTRITVVGIDGRLVYESYVIPDNEIIDYNTRFSGITAKHLNKPGTKTLKQAQNDLRGFINANTILIGHGLENDLRALRLIHKTVVDTAYSFPHYNGLPYKRSLKSLVTNYLKRDIQQNEHDSYEDAYSCMELMLWRVRKDCSNNNSNFNTS